MNKISYTEFSGDRRMASRGKAAMRAGRSDPPIVVQVLSVVAFGVFSIVAIALAFAAFWLVGLVLAMVIASTWAGTRTFGGKRRWRHHRAARSVSDLAPSVSPARSSGNASFDAYRSEMLERLEQESVEFQGFLTRLREAHDAVEFDQFMDDRASASRDTSSRDTARHTETAGY